MKRPILFAESMTRIHVPHKHWAVRVWRQEDPANFQPENGDIISVVKDYNGGSKKELAELICQLDRVNACEVLDMMGEGVVLYTEW